MDFGSLHYEHFARKTLLMLTIKRLLDLIEPGDWFTMRLKRHMLSNVQGNSLCVQQAIVCLFHGLLHFQHVCGSDSSAAAQSGNNCPLLCQIASNRGQVQRMGCGPPSLVDFTPNQDRVCN